MSLPKINEDSQELQEKQVIGHLEYDKNYPTRTRKIRNVCQQLKLKIKKVIRDYII